TAHRPGRRQGRKRPQRNRIAGRGAPGNTGTDQVGRLAHADRGQLEHRFQADDEPGLPAACRECRENRRAEYFARPVEYALANKSREGPMRVIRPGIAVVTRKTRMQGLLERWATRPAARFRLVQAKVGELVRSGKSDQQWATQEAEVEYEDLDREDVV